MILITFVSKLPNNWSKKYTGAMIYSPILGRCSISMLPENNKRLFGYEKFSGGYRNGILGNNELLFHLFLSPLTTFCKAEMMLNISRILFADTFIISSNFLLNVSFSQKIFTQ